MPRVYGLLLYRLHTPRVHQRQEDVAFVGFGLDGGVLKRLGDLAH
jgi:hypothetical protein